MKKRYLKTLVFMLIVMIIIGILLLSALFRNGDLIDRSIIFDTPQIIFILSSGFVLVGSLIFIIHGLNKQRSILQANLNINKLNEIKETENDLYEDIEQTEESRFFMLTHIDETSDKYNDYIYKDDISLEELCIEFRHYAASKLKLYYDIKDIRRFIGGLAVSQIMILQGMSGTGKTSLAYAFGEYMNNQAVVVPIQPMWKERTDLIGYYNEFTKKFNETTLFQKLYEANYNDQIYITVLDEMNIARVEYYFAEFLSLLELPDHKKRYLDVISDMWENDPKLLNEGKLLLPRNMWFVGTANNDDSTFAISDKVYDRAMVINLDKKATPFIGDKMTERRISASGFIEKIKHAQSHYEISKRNLRRIKEIDAYLIKHFQITFGNRIMGQIRNYVPVILACGGSELEAIDDILSKKVLRKLETKNMVYVKSAVPGLISFMDDLFGPDAMEQCREYIQKIEINA